MKKLALYLVILSMTASTALSWLGNQVTLAGDSEHHGAASASTSGLTNGSPSALATPSEHAPRFDISVRPQDDLYQYVNGNWLRATVIPQDKSSYGAFAALRDTTRKHLRSIIDDVASRDYRGDCDQRKIGDFYKSFMNEALANSLGLAPLKNELAEVEKLETKADLAQHFGRLQQWGVAGPIGFYVGQDDKDSSRYIATVCQDGTTLPDRDYYLKDEPRFCKSRTALAAYMERLLGLSGHKNPAEAAKALLKLETSLAEIQWDRTRLRSPLETYNKLHVDELVKLAPGVAWERFFAGLGIQNLDALNVVTPSFFKGLGTILGETDMATWRDYLRFRILDAYAPVLSTPFVDTHFELYGKTLAGIPKLRPRWERAVAATATAGGFGVLGDAVGRLYVERHFDPRAKAKIDGLVAHLLAAFQESINELKWMSPGTKARAQEKLSKMTVKVGYGDHWRDYSSLEIHANDLVGNLMRSSRFEFERMLGKLDSPVDRNEWDMPPHTVNAYYSPSMNEIVFPAAILQPPFFDPQADDAVNYGAIGAVIGHEISHAFDDQGSQYDGDGNLNNWWTDEDRRAFEELIAKVVTQYEAYQPLPGQPINGRLTLGENIADLSGLAVAYKAYEISLAGREPERIDGLTGCQRFFLGWAQAWRCKYRDAELAMRLLTDPHSPAPFRANGAVSNMDAFYNAFDVKPGDRLYRPLSERVRIW